MRRRRLRSVASLDDADADFIPYLINPIASARACSRPGSLRPESKPEEPVALQHSLLCRWACRSCGFANGLPQICCTMCDASRPATCDIACVCVRERNTQHAVACTSPERSRHSVKDASWLSGVALTGNGNAHETLCRLAASIQALRMAVGSGGSVGDDECDWEPPLAALAAAVRRALAMPTCECHLVPDEARHVLAAGDEGIALAAACGWGLLRRADDDGKEISFVRAPMRDPAAVALLRSVGGQLERSRPTLSELAWGARPPMRAPLLRCPPSFDGRNAHSLRLRTTDEALVEHASLLVAAQAGAMREDELCSYGR